MSSPTSPPAPDSGTPPKPPTASLITRIFRSPTGFLAIVSLVALGVILSQGMFTPRSQIRFDEFDEQVKKGNVEGVTIQDLVVVGEFKTAPKVPRTKLVDG